jgi:hypothetical protein
MKRLLAVSLLAALVATPIVLAQQPAGKPATTGQSPKATAAQPPKDDKGAEKAKPADKPKVEEKGKSGEDSDKPGPNHKMLAALEGEWAAEVRELTPGAETTDKGTMTCKMVYGGRFLMMDFDGRSHGKFFKGGGLWGYNNAQKRFESTWADSMGTGIVFMSGSTTGDGKVFTMTGESNDPATGKGMSIKEVSTIKDKNTWHTDFFLVNGGKEMKVMEIEYTRAKGEKPAEKDKPAVK